LPSKSATSRISSLYRFLWGFPIQGRLLGLAVIISLLASASMIRVGGFGKYSLLVSLGFLFSVFVNWVADHFDLGLLNLRRMNQITTVNFIILIIGCLLSFYTPIGLIAFTMFAAVGSFLRTIIYLSLAGRRVLKASPFLFSGMISESVPSAFFLNNKTYGIAMIGSYIVGSGLALMLILILVKFFLIKRVSIWNYVSSVLAVLLDGKRNWLEEIAENLDEEAEIRVDVLCFRDPGKTKPKLAILIPTFHPGPFKNFGSSGLIYEIAEELRTRGIEAIFFKGPSNHETNVITSRDCEKISRGIVEAVERSYEAFYKSSASPPKKFRVGDAKGLLVSVGGFELLFLTKHPKGMEDIPPSILKNVGDDSLIPVDAHNCFSDEVKDLDDESVNEFLMLLEKASKESSEERSPLLLGYSRSTLEDFSLEDGIGGLGISAVVFGPKDALTAIIALDGNNCLPEVRDAITERLKPLGFKAIEVVTTDTHIVNGLKFGGRGYHPLGEVIPASELARRSFEAAEAALEKLHTAEVTRLNLRFHGIKVMSPSFLEEAAAKSYHGIALFFSFLAASIVLGSFWGLCLL